jgi:hypothetical protein
MHENYLESGEGRKYLCRNSANYVAFPAYYHIKCVSTARTLVDILITFGFELPTVGEKSEGNNAENMFAETVSVEMD